MFKIVTTKRRNIRRRVPWSLFLPVKFYDCIKFKGITTRNGKIAEVEISRELETKRAPLKTLAQRVQPTALAAFLIEKINNSRRRYGDRGLDAEASPFPLQNFSSWERKRV